METTKLVQAFENDLKKIETPVFEVSWTLAGATLVEGVTAVD